MVHGFDVGAATKSTLDQALNVNLPLVLCTDSHSLFDCLGKLGTTLEKRLKIDVMCLRQSYERREISEVSFVVSAMFAQALLMIRNDDVTPRRVTDRIPRAHAFGIPIWSLLGFVFIHLCKEHTADIFFKRHSR